MKIEAIGFDFDDTLMYTMKMKADVFGQTMNNLFGVNASKASLIYDEIANTVPRTQRVAEVGKRIGRIFSETDTNKFNKAYTEAINVEMVKRDLAPGVRKVLRTLAALKTQRAQEGKKLVVFVQSNSQQKDVETILKAKGITDFFDMILARPTKKEESFSVVSKKFKIPIKNMIAVGDSHGDLKAAKKKNIPCVLVYPGRQRHEALRGMGGTIIANNLHSFFKTLRQLDPELSLQASRTIISSRSKRKKTSGLSRRRRNRLL